ncbi:MAG: cation transporter [Deltaproteobacteria bacterium]|jgi:cation diffusion facilitator family transporter|nr:cation transporter [Deltaproteobacteria bacterium]
MASSARADRDRQVERVLIGEGIANLAVMAAKATVGFHTGSVAVIGDAVHSLADFANNAVAFLATRIANAPPDPEHPYGHRKFETLAVFGIATLLSVLAIEIILGALDRDAREISREPWGLALMLGVLVVNVLISLWENRWARRLDSDILRADARHTIADVLTTIAVILGWQLAARGLPWLDALASVIVAGMILYLAYGLFQKAIPVLVEGSIANPDALSNAASAVDGVQETRRVRSRQGGSGPTIDLVVSVDPDLSTAESHAIADEIERVISETFSVSDVTVHIEPH